MGSTAEVIEVERDGSNSLMAGLLVVCVRVGMISLNGFCRLFLVEVPFVLVEFAGLRRLSDFMRSGGHSVDFVVDNDSQTQGIKLDKVWEQVQ